MARQKMILAPPLKVQIPADEQATGDARLLLDPEVWEHTKPLRLKLRILGNRVVLFLAQPQDWIMMTPEGARRLGKELVELADKLEKK